MKNIFFVFVGFLFCQSVQAQEAAFGIKIGLSTNNLDIKRSEQIEVGDTTFRYSAGDTRVGFHAGLMGRITFNKFMIQPELYVSGSNNEYKLEKVFNGTVLDDGTPKNPSESIVKLNVPILFGYKIAGPLRINAGPVATLILSDDNGLLEAIGNAAEGEPNNFTFGLQAGLGVDISKLTIDLRYETSLSNYGDGITVAGKEYQFDTRMNQLSLSLGILF